MLLRHTHNTEAIGRDVADMVPVLLLRHKPIEYANVCGLAERSTLLIASRLLRAIPGYTFTPMPGP
jgi:hypothetical protein